MDDMLDMLHYLFETDTIAEEEVQKAKLKMRRTLYRVLYVRNYTWMDDESEYHEFGTQEASGGPLTTSLTHKPYVPPTPVRADAPRPYGAILDAPLG
jgi:hypothetical protein